MPRGARALARWTGFVHDHALAVVVITMIITMLLARYAVGHLGINTDTADMISPKLSWRQDFIEYREAFPQLWRSLIVVIDADNADLAASAQQALARQLARQPALFPRVFAPETDPFFARNGLLYLPRAELDTLADRLVRMQPLLARLAREPNLTGLADMLETAAGTGKAPAELAPLLAALADALEASTQDRFHRLSWLELTAEPGASAASHRRLLLVQPALQYETLAPAKAPIAAVRAAAAALELDAAHGVSVRLTGPIALEYEELLSVERGAATAGVLALLLVAIVLFWGLRSLRLVIAALLSLVCGLIATAAFAAFAVGRLNLISVAFAVLYIGLGIDFAIHLCLRYRELLLAGMTPRAALGTAASDVGSSLVLCAVTTSIGFFAFFPTTFSGVAELGLISGTGMYISLLLSLTLLPALLTLLGPPAAPQRTAPTGLAVLAGLDVSRRAPRLMLASAAVAGAAALVLLPSLRFDPNPLNLRDPASESVQAYTELLAAQRGSPLTLQVLAADRERARDIATRLAELPLVAAARTLEDFVPDEQSDKLAVIEELGLLMGPGLETSAAPQPDAPAQSAALDRLATALTALSRQASPPADAQARNALDALQRFERQLAANPAAAPRRLQTLHTSLFAGFGPQLERLALSLQAGEVTLEDLPDALIERWRSRDGRYLVEIEPAEPLLDASASRRLVEAVRSVAPQVTGLPVVQLGAGDAVVSAFRQALVAAVVVVGVLVAVLMGSVRATALVLTPVLLAGLLTAGAMVLLAMPLNFANVIALPLLLGVGVDNGIHLVHRAGRAAPAHGNLLATSTARGILFSALTTVTSFGTLALSQHPGTASMGRLLAIGMLMTVVCTLLLLPALLHLQRGAGAQDAGPGPGLL